MAAADPPNPCAGTIVDIVAHEVRSRLPLWTVGVQRGVVDAAGYYVVAIIPVVNDSTSGVVEELDAKLFFPLPMTAEDEMGQGVASRLALARRNLLAYQCGAGARCERLRQVMAFVAFVDLSGAVVFYRCDLPTKK